VLHDRRIPGTRANIDHIVVATSGVWVVDTKHYRGQVSRRDVGGVFRRDVRLYVRGRDRTKLVTAMTAQVLAVHQALPATADVVRPALCFTAAEWSWFAVPFEVQGVVVTWPRALVKSIRTATSSGIDVVSVGSELAERLPAAS